MKKLMIFFVRKSILQNHSMNIHETSNFWKAYVDLHNKIGCCRSKDVLTEDGYYDDLKVLNTQ